MSSAKESKKSSPRGGHRSPSTSPRRGGGRSARSSSPPHKVRGARRAKAKKDEVVGPEGKYEGPLREGVRHTHECTTDGEVFGRAADCKCEVRATLTWGNGDIYVGEFRNGLREGQGRYTWSKGRRTYEGSWLRGQKGGGVGTEKWPNGDVYDGHYSEGQFHGKGMLRTRLGKYEGEFEHGVKHGEGRMEWYSGDVYDGDWYRNKLHGEGEYFSKDGRSYVGEWVDGKRSGRGMELLPNGEKYDGDWVDNIKHGVATYRWPNGRWREGIWTKGKRIKWLSEERIGGVRRAVVRRGAMKTKHREIAAQQAAADVDTKLAGGGAGGRAALRSRE